MLHNNSKESRRFLSTALLGILVFLVVMFVQNVPERLQRGRQGAQTFSCWMPCASLCWLLNVEN